MAGRLGPALRSRAVHLRQDHGYKAWTIARFNEHFPELFTGDVGLALTALHVLHHTRAGGLELNDLGVAVADLRVDLSDADHKPSG